MRQSLAEVKPQGGFVSGIILAAGASRRLGEPKQLLLLGDRSFLQHVIDEASASRLSEVIVVLGHRAEEVQRAIKAGPKVRFAINNDYAEGQSTSLRLGINSVSKQANAVAVLLGDQPGVTARLIDDLAAELYRSGRPAARPAYTARGRRVPGHPVLLAQPIWSEVTKLEGDQGARSLFAAHPDWLHEVPIDSEPPADIDTRNDYEALVRRHQASEATAR